jgi:hypothetical protein
LAVPNSIIGSCGRWRSTASPRPLPRRCASGAISAVSSPWAALGYALFIIIRTLTTGIVVPGYASLMVAILFLADCSSSRSASRRYVGRILTETKARPLYVVRGNHRRRLMERKVYDQMAKLDSCHWWFTARRRILDGVIERIVRPPRDARILELGAGTGHNLAMLSRFGEVEASELDPVARDIASERLGRPVIEAALPGPVDVPGQIL